DLRNASFSFADRKTSFNPTGQNLIDHLDYSALHPSYTGELDMSPLYLKLGANKTVNVIVKLPVTLEKDRISVANAQLLSPQSQVVISGSMEHMLAPRYAAYVNARIALDEVRRAGAVTIPLDTNRAPGIVTADLAASMGDDFVRIQSARLTAGRSNLEASGTLKDGNKPGAGQF